MKTRFEREISGELGEFWKKDATKRVQKVQDDFNAGNITVDEQGVLRNCIGRVAVTEVREMCKYLGIKFDEEETKIADEYETRQSIAEYKARQRNRKMSEEELAEMRAAFGAGAVVVDVLTGKRIVL